MVENNGPKKRLTKIGLVERGLKKVQIRNYLTPNWVPGTTIVSKNFRSKNKVFGPV